jgi:cell wall-active antibiotic response 4TMS protein YvqF
MNDGNREKRTDGVVGGVILITLGVIFLLEQQGLLAFAGIRNWWPLIVVAVGLAKLIGGGSGRRRRGGLWVLFVGLWLLANANHYWGLDWHNSWPIMVIGFGTMLVLGSLFGDRCGGEAVRHVE